MDNLICCPTCHYSYPDYDDDEGFYSCPSCGEIWGLDDDDPDYEEEPLDLGTCCICGGTEDVRNMIMLPKKAPVPGTGWGCVVCGLPADGATAVVCDSCLQKIPEDERNDGLIKEIIYGYPSDKRRIAYKPEILQDFNHDLTKHDEVYGGYVNER